MRFKAFLALLLVSCVLLPALAQTKPATQTQQPPPAAADDKDDVVKITTNLVQVDAVVTREGKTVPNLTAEDFEIYEDGKRQTITSFAYISNVPNAAQPAVKTRIVDTAPPQPIRINDPHRTIAVVVDDLGLSAESISRTRQQLRKFVAEELQPNDLVAILRTSGELGALQQFTNDKRVLNRAVDQMRWNICSRMGVSVIPSLNRFNNHDDEFQCGGGSYYQTMKSLRFILDAMGQLPGRKSMILLSDHVPRESQELTLDSDRLAAFPTFNYGNLLNRIAEKAIRSSVVIYSVDTQGLVYTGITAADHIVVSSREINRTINEVTSQRSNLVFTRRAGSDLLARQTGGFQIRNSNSFELGRIVEDQSGYYLLGYRPTTETFNKEFHHIKAKVKRSRMTLRTRFGFFGVSEEEASKNRPTPRDSTNLALASPFGTQDIELNLTSFFTNDQVSGSVIRSFLYIGAKDLAFTPVDDRKQATIELHGVIFGDNGSIVQQATRGVTVSLSENDYEIAMRNGMALTFDMTVKKPGAYQVRVAARDRVSSKIGSAGEFVAVPNLNNKRLAVSGIVIGNSSDLAGPTISVTQALANPGARYFEPNSDLHFAYLIYNAASRNLVTETRLFRDGKTVYSGPETPIDTANQQDPGRLLARGTVRLTPDLEPGYYYLQIAVTDKTANDKEKDKDKDKATTVQWISFEIVK